MRYTEITALVLVLFLIGIILVMGILAGQLTVEMLGKYLEVVERVGMVMR